MLFSKDMRYPYMHVCKLEKHKYAIYIFNMVDILVNPIWGKNF